MRSRRFGREYSLETSHSGDVQPAQPNAQVSPVLLVNLDPSDQTSNCTGWDQRLVPVFHRIPFTSRHSPDRTQCGFRVMAQSPQKVAQRCIYIADFHRLVPPSITQPYALNAPKRARAVFSTRHPDARGPEQGTAGDLLSTVTSESPVTGHMCKVEPGVERMEPQPRASTERSAGRLGCFWNEFYPKAQKGTLSLLGF
ncbi:unnamed protein product [Durusdinium trenchii]|uniref:Uncharacterized protein n=1 Tax=Durusdinium trenchii TaxID=1381693 RepID=A0ABP0S776_9DINO